MNDKLWYQNEKWTFLYNLSGISAGKIICNLPKSFYEYEYSLPHEIHIRYIFTAKIDALKFTNLYCLMVPFQIKVKWKKISSHNFMCVIYAKTFSTCDKMLKWFLRNRQVDKKIKVLYKMEEFQSWNKVKLKNELWHHQLYETTDFKGKWEND